jgi:hypothetical protein
MKLISSFYKTSSLAKNGVFILIVSALILIIGALFIPNFEGKATHKQIYNLNGFTLKFNDDPETSTFFQSIIKNDGYLCLGTSESTTPVNYFDFLNNDVEIAPRFSVLAGAGRTCGVYIPLLYSQKESVKGLKIIYYINPAYWRSNLCELDKSYWDRYTNYTLAKNLNLSENEQVNFGKPIETYFETLNTFEKSTHTIESGLRSLRKSYFHDLYYHLNPEKYDEQFLYIHDRKNNLGENKQFQTPKIEGYDTTWNILSSFQEKHWYKSIDEEQDFRYEELRAFIHLCKSLEIEATFIVAPYNDRFIRQYDPSSIYAYPKTMSKIKALLNQEKVPYIDATDISTINGTFDDHQHHSSYGAYLIYHKIKNYLNHE